MLQYAGSLDVQRYYGTPVFSAGDSSGTVPGQRDYGTASAHISVQLNTDLSATVTIQYTDNQSPAAVTLTIPAATGSLPAAPAGTLVFGNPSCDANSYYYYDNLEVSLATIPTPFVDILQPTAAVPGSTLSSLTISGANFVSGSAVNFNGSILTPATVTSSQIVVNGIPSLPANAVTLPVTVINPSSPSPAVGTSNVGFFPVAGAAPSVTTNLTSWSLNRPYPVAVGDFNGDGNLDLAVGRFNDGLVDIFLGTATGTFPTTPSFEFTVGANPRSIAVGDFDGDGKLDLVVACRGNNAAEIYLGDGTGNFGTGIFATPASVNPVGNSPESVVVGDFNGDGKLDVAVTHFSTDAVYVLLGNGDGTMQSAVPYLLPTGSKSRFLTTGDFNGDGRLDLAVTDSAVGKLSILLGNGDGTFQPRVDYNTGTSPLGVVAGDFNGDGKLDVAVANGGSNTVSVFLGDGAGNFSLASSPSTGTTPTGIAAGDFNNDGNLDLAVGNGATTSTTLSILLGDGAGNFSLTSSPSTGVSTNGGLAVGDFNRDGKLDFVAISFSAPSTIGTVSVLLQTVPDLTITKTHTGTFAPGDVGDTYTITVTNSGSGTTNGTVTVTDNLPAGLTATSISGTGWTCTPPSGPCTRSDALPTNTSYDPITLTVNVNSNAPASITNTATVSGGGEANTSNDTASDTASLVAPPTISKVFGNHPSIPLNGTISLTFTITNPNSGASLTGVGFSDGLPSGLVVAASSGLTNTGCGGTASTPDSSTVSLSGGALTGGASCSIAVNVTGTTPGAKSNHVTVTSDAGTGNTSTDTITVVAPPTIQKAFSPSTIPSGNVSTLNFTISNSNGTSNLNGVTFTDNLQSGLQVANPPDVTNTCGGTFAPVAGNTSFTLTNGTVTAASSCTLSVNVTGSVGSYTNTTTAINSNEGGQGTTSNAAPLSIVSPVCFAPPPNMVSWWPAENNANDVVGGYNGTVHGATFAAGEVGQAFSFNGANEDYVLASNTTNIAGGPQATYDAWVYPTAVPATGNYFALFGAGDGTQSTWDPEQCRMLYFNSTGSPQFYMDCGVNNSNTPINRSTAKSYPPNAWYHVAGVVNNGNIDLYVDGVLDDGTGTSVAGASINTNAAQYVWMGALVSTNQSLVAAGFTGLLDEVEIFNRALTATEIQNIYIAGSKGKCKANATISKSFNPSSIPSGGTSTLGFTITNPASTEINLTGIQFSDPLPSGVTVASPLTTTNTCGGTFAPNVGNGTVSASNISLATGTSCSLSVKVTSSTPGTVSNTTGPISSNEAGTGSTSNTVSLTVVAPPSIAKVFNPSTIALNATSSLNFTITNPTGNPVALAGVGFTDNLPSGVTVATSSPAGVCGGTLTTTAPSSIVLSGATIVVGTPCTFSVTVTGAASGPHTNTTGNVTSTTPPPTGTTGNQATATLTVGTPPSISKAFGAASIPVGGTTSLTFTLTNPAGNASSLTGVTFTDSLPAGLVVASPNGLSNHCGGTVTATAGSSTVTLSGVTLAVGKSCTLSVNVKGTTAGVKNNSVTASSSQSGSSSPGTASITVVAPPTISKVFGAASILVGGSTSLSFTITNPNTTMSLTGISFSDSLPSGMVVSNPNGLTGSCDGGTITATKNTSTISLSGATLAAGASCTFSVNVTGASAGKKNNTTGSITANECQSGGTASASINVLTVPTITKTFGASSIQLNGSTTLSFTVSNPSANPVALTGIGFTDNLPSGLVVSTPNGLSGSCDSGTITATQGTGSIMLSGASLNAGSSCTFSAKVTGTTGGTKNNTTLPVTSTQTGPGGTASATLSVVTSAPDLTITKTHSGNFTQGQTGAQYTITVKNAGNAPTAGTVKVTDTLPSGLTATSISGTGWSCTAPSGPCTRSDALNAGSSYSSITLKVTVATSAPSSVTNSATVSGGGESNTANDTASDPTNINAVTTVNFDSPSCPSSNVGTYGGINWPSPWGCETAGYANDSTRTMTWTQNITSKTFTFVKPSVLTSLRAGGGSTGSITISTDQGESVSLTISQTKTMTLYQTGFTKPATTVTVKYPGGWTMELDDLTYSTAP